MSVADVISVNEPADLLKEIIKIPSIRKDETKVAEGTIKTIANNNTAFCTICSATDLACSNVVSTVSWMRATTFCCAI